MPVGPMPSRADGSGPHPVGAVNGIVLMRPDRATFLILCDIAMPGEDVAKPIDAATLAAVVSLLADWKP
jgi:hypothetical protein